MGARIQKKISSKTKEHFLVIFVPKTLCFLIQINKICTFEVCFMSYLLCVCERERDIFEIFANTEIWLSFNKLFNSTDILMFNSSSSGVFIHLRIKNCFPTLWLGTFLTHQCLKRDWLLKFRLWGRTTPFH